MFYHKHCVFPRSCIHLPLRERAQGLFLPQLQVTSVVPVENAARGARPRSFHELGWTSTLVMATEAKDGGEAVASVAGTSLARCCPLLSASLAPSLRLPNSC